VAAGEGKGWSKGRSARDDPRIGRAAAAHRGMQYVPRVPPELDRRRRGTGAFDPTWTPALAYAVGLIATDGGLVRGRSLAFPSADRELVALLLRCLGKSNTISVERSRSGGIYYRTQIGDVAMYRWLLSIGIEPRKSLTIGAIDVPDEFLFPFVRGLLDGDGSIMNKVARADTKRRTDYRWEYLQTKFVSGSRKHLVWLRTRLADATGLDGYLMTTKANGRRHACYALRFSKLASVRLLPLLYADPAAPRLTRKWRVWEDYAVRHRIALSQPRSCKVRQQRAQVE
jgi:hypothetical protein